MFEARSNPLIGLLGKLTARSPIASEDRAALLGLPYTSRVFEAGGYLVREGDTPDHCSFLVSGLAYSHKASGEGLRQIVAIHVPGDAFDLQLLYLEIADYNVQTLSQCKIVTIPRYALRHLAACRPSVAHAIVVAALVEASIAQEWLLNIGRRDARTRLAHLLCELAVRLDRQDMPAGKTYKIPMTQEQLGDALGLTSVYINKKLKSLVRDGFINYGKRRIELLNWEGLVQIADFDSRYLHLNKLR